MKRLTYSEALGFAAIALADAAIENPRSEARRLIAHILRLPAGAMPTSDATIPGDALRDAVSRRAAREPMAFITGTQGFWTLELEVSPETLIPRPDSETLIEAALAARPHRDAVRRVLDLGTGTGCLLLAALSEYPAAFGAGVDLRPGAAALAARNARRAGLADRAAFLAGRWAAALAARFDLVLCNPPYIPTGDLPGLMPEVGRHEPASALDGGVSGLDAYRTLLPALPDLLAPGGLAVLELGSGQAESVSHLATEAGFAGLSLRQDVAGIPRALILDAPR